MVQIVNKTGTAYLVEKIKALISDKMGHIGSAASARGSASSQTIGTSRTAIMLNTWISRNDTAFEFVNGGIKMPYTGNVLISGGVYGAGGTNTTGCYVAKGTSSDSRGTELFSQNMTGVIGGIVAGAKVISVTAGDIIYLQGRCSVNLNFVPNNAATHLSATYVK